MNDDSPGAQSTIRAAVLNPAFPIAMLVVWAVVTFGFSPAPGWIHLLLTLGVFLLIYGIVVRGSTSARTARNK
ncbi:MAG: hypothetical protein M3081_20020 [Gemmatimonadota bacterium]|nr:hypothetical protein [Gemmatimonadota bacterium]